MALKVRMEPFNAHTRPWDKSSLFAYELNTHPKNPSRRAWIFHLYPRLTLLQRKVDDCAPRK